MNAVFTTSGPASDRAFGDIALWVLVAIVLLATALPLIAGRVRRHRAKRAAAKRRHPAGRGFVQAYVARSEDLTGLPNPSLYDREADKTVWPERVTRMSPGEARFFDWLDLDMPERAQWTAEWVARNDGDPDRNRWARS